LIDVTEQVNSVRRQVGSRMLEAGEARTVTIARTYDATLEDLWDACTTPERIARWFLPVTGDLRIGGRYALTGNASGTIERCEPPTSFAATWEFGGDTSWIEVHLSPAGDGRTTLSIEHISHVGDERWEQFGPGALGVGWDLMLLGLSLYMTSGRAKDPKEAMAWPASDEGREFIALSSRGWRDAGVAAGTDPAAAQSAADRTTSFYTGPGG
jgi:uncharacterized protein YndB with AHSA1/START domain